jgi:hypothetical protein
MDRYLDLFDSKIISFPARTLILSDQRYAIDGSYPFRIMQAPSFNEFLQTLKGKVVPQKQEPITIKSNL